MVAKNFIISIFILIFITSLAFPTQSSDFEKKLRDMGINMPANTDLNQIMQQYKELLNEFDKATSEAAKIAGIPEISVTKAPTPEKETERRRKIINYYYKQMKPITSAIHTAEENPQIPEAITVEGYIFVKGGERKFWSHNQIETDIGYAIREEFIGNLIILHTYDIKTRKFEKEKDYMLDTLSTNIKLENMAGKKCTRWSSLLPSTCINYTTFTLYEIDKGENYPNFYSGVVSIAESEKGKVTIEAQTPVIYFYGGSGTNKVSAQVQCTSGSWTISKSEIERLLQGQELTLKKEIGSSSRGDQSCTKGSTITLHLKLKKDETDKCKEYRNVKIKIVEPEHLSKFVFTSDATGILNIVLKAKTEPSKYENLIEWDIPELDGSKTTIKNISNLPIPQGPVIEVKYEGLPFDVKSFGIKTIGAKVNIDGCVKDDYREILIFYPRDAKNNPEGKYYNWFYYWKQTPAARPFGQIVNIEFGGTDFDLCKDKHTMAIYKPNYLFKSIHICDFTAKLDRDFSLKIPHVSRNVPATLYNLKKFISYTHIDTFAVIVMHEFTHFNHYHTWWNGKSLEEMEKEDKDRDGIPDRLEDEMGFSPKLYQTYWGDDIDFKNINGDEEFLAYESTYDYPIGKYDEHDWGVPGKNWQ